MQMWQFPSADDLVSVSCVSRSLRLALALVAAGLLNASAQAQSYSVLYSFHCQPDAANPYADLTRDSAGNLYGTTYHGGVSGAGSVFKLSPTGTETLLHSFSSSPNDVESPVGASLIVDDEGNIYGTSPFGGRFGVGAVFELTKDAEEVLLYSFTGNADGNTPSGGLLLDRAGDLYGTTEYGGAYQTGVVFRLAPSGIETILHNFGDWGSGDGIYPIGSLISDPSGNLYGATATGGAFQRGTVFQLASGGRERIIHSFAGPPDDGWAPDGSLARTRGGDLYGSTYQGGSYDGGSYAYGAGTIFKVSASGTQSTLLSFNGRGDGAEPVNGLALGESGNVYGTTVVGGSALCSEYPYPPGCGVLFKVDSEGMEQTLHRFGQSPTDGRLPYAGVIQDPAGNLYGTTFYGGSYGCGTVFKYTP